MLLIAAPAIAEEDDDDEEDVPRKRKPISQVLFGSMEAGPAKTFGSFGVKRAIGGKGLNVSGFRSLVAVGITREGASSVRPHGRAYKSTSQALAGYEWHLPGTVMALYGGSDTEAGYAQGHNFSAIMRPRTGKRLQFDLWTHPTDTMTLQANAYASTLDRQLWGRLAADWPLYGEMRAGPEMEIYRERGYHQLRVGWHVTGLPLFGLNWRLSSGWQQSNTIPAQAYIALGLHWRK